MVREPKRIYLFAQPSFLAGFVKLLDLAGAVDEYNRTPTPEIADYYATYSDWKAVGDDLLSAISTFDKEIRAK